MRLSFLLLLPDGTIGQFMEQTYLLILLKDLNKTLQLSRLVFISAVISLFQFLRNMYLNTLQRHISTLEACVLQRYVF